MALPFIPEFVVVTTALIAKLAGCEAGSGAPCLLGPSSAGDIIRGALETGSGLGHGFSMGLAAVWLAVCCFLVTQGWTRLSSRLLLAFALTIICAFAPYFGPMLSISRLGNANCGVDESGQPCRIYGSNLTESVYGAVKLGENIFEGAPIALAIFVGYVVLALVSHFRSEREATSTS